MTDANFTIRSEMSNFLRGYSIFWEEKPQKNALELTVYMCINGQNHRLDAEYPLVTDDVAKLVARSKANFRFDIASLWILNPADDVDFMHSRGKFADLDKIDLRMVNANTGETITELKDPYDA